MAEPFGVDFDRLKDMVGRMAHYQQFLHSMLDEVEVVVSNVHRTWEGAASQTHIGVHEPWRTAAETMGQALSQLQHATQHAHEAYVAAVQANRNIWG